MSYMIRFAFLSTHGNVQYACLFVNWICIFQVKFTSGCLPLHLASWCLLFVLNIWPQYICLTSYGAPAAAAFQSSFGIVESRWAIGLMRGLKFLNTNILMSYPIFRSNIIRVILGQPGFGWHYWLLFSFIETVSVHSWLLLAVWIVSIWLGECSSKKTKKQKKTKYTHTHTGKAGYTVEIQPCSPNLPPHPPKSQSATVDFIESILWRSRLPLPSLFLSSPHLLW